MANNNEGAFFVILHEKASDLKSLKKRIAWRLKDFIGKEKFECTIVLLEFELNPEGEYGKQFKVKVAVASHEALAEELKLMQEDANKIKSYVRKTHK